MKAVMLAIQPYYVFLIIAWLMGWDIPQHKTGEVRKDFPKDSAWNRTVHIYCSKDRKSFNRIPKQYQPLMAKFLGKVIGDFVCDKVEQLYIPVSNSATPPDKEAVEKATCLSFRELKEYVNGKMFLYGWHISDLKIYDKPKELSEFRTPPCDKPESACDNCKHKVNVGTYCEPEYDCPIENGKPLTRPPQSWCYVEELSE